MTFQRPKARGCLSIRVANWDLIEQDVKPSIKPSDWVKIVVGVDIEFTVSNNLMQSTAVKGLVHNKAINASESLQELAESFFHELMNQTSRKEIHLSWIIQGKLLSKTLL